MFANTTAYRTYLFLWIYTVEWILVLYPRTDKISGHQAQVEKKRKICQNSFKKKYKAWIFNIAMESCFRSRVPIDAMLVSAKSYQTSHQNRDV